MSISRSLAIACMAAVVVTACASESDGDGEGSSGGSTGGADRSISSYLAALPADDGGDAVVVTYADLARAAEIGGIERPEDPSDSDAVVDYLIDIDGTRREEGEGQRVSALLPTAAQVQRSASDLEAFVDEVGWSVLDVDAFAERETPPRRISLLTGDFDRDALDGALDDNGDDGWLIGNPDGGIDIEGVSVARPLGETLWMDLDDDRLAIAWADGDIGRVAESDGGDETLAGDRGLAALAAALDDLGVYSAMLESNEDHLSEPYALRVLGAAATPAQRAALEDGPQCAGMTAMAVGLADDGEPLLVLAIAHSDEDAAAGNVDAVDTALTEGDHFIRQQPWSDMFTIDSVEADGTVVVATARPADMILYQWYQVLVDRSFPPC